MIKDHIEYFLNNMGPQDYEIISEALSWDNDKKVAFGIARKIFYENEEREMENLWMELGIDEN